MDGEYEGNIAVAREGQVRCDGKHEDYARHRGVSKGPQFNQKTIFFLFFTKIELVASK